MAGFWQGATNVLVRELGPEQLVDTMIAERVTHGASPPSSSSSCSRARRGGPGLERT